MKALITAMLITMATLVTDAGPDWASILKDTDRQVPRIEIEQDGTSGICSAVIFDVTIGVALTAAHCIPTAGEYDITLNGRHAKVARANHKLDLAILRFDPKNERAMTFAPGAPQQGSDAAVLGYPFGSETYHVQAGIVSAPFDRDCKCLKLNAEVIPGDSGGAIVDAQGRLIGLTTTIFFAGPATLQGAVPIETIRDFVEPYMRDLAKEKR